jgi:predicted nuclease of predicted toxin-antitoxin system
VRLLLDACVWGGARAAVQEAGHEVVWVGDWDSDPGDEEILALAHQEGRVLVTLDKDFGELALVQRMPHCGIVRLVNFSARQQAAACLRVLALHGQELQQGALVTAEPGRLRIRPPESGSQ